MRLFLFLFYQHFCLKDGVGFFGLSLGLRPDGLTKIPVTLFIGFQSLHLSSVNHYTPIILSATLKYGSANETVKSMVKAKQKLTIFSLFIRF